MRKQAGCAVWSIGRHYTAGSRRVDWPPDAGRHDTLGPSRQTGVGVVCSNCGTETGRPDHHSAGIAALDGRPANAAPLSREALREWRDFALAWDEALCGLDMVTLLDPTEPEVREIAESTRGILVR